VKTTVVSTSPQNIFFSVHGGALKENISSDVLSKVLGFCSEINDFRGM